MSVEKIYGVYGLALFGLRLSIQGNNKRMEQYQLITNIIYTNKQIHVNENCLSKTDEKQHSKAQL